MARVSGGRVTAPPGLTPAPNEHRDSLHEDVEIDITRHSVRTYQRAAALMTKRQDLHAAEVRKFARSLARDYLAECEREARAASVQEFRGWVARKLARLSACDQRIGGPNWRTSS